ncbi:hypothetical protein E6O75_ATG04767 [Venturia nashicola]|uniref:Uncharacterized protein n=1 Tax=Venturia nashicola TaxID=86259 RepID=A0A4Z1NZ14_9PEZI|nr:hypothetical protein E6O75_ATG04767 [Venturia nashicola]
MLAFPQARQARQAPSQQPPKSNNKTQYSFNFKMAASSSSLSLPSMTPYHQYSAIDPSTSKLPLTRLFGGDAWQPIASLSSRYTQAKTGKQARIVVKSKGVQVTNNLDEALLHLRHPDCVPYLWMETIVSTKATTKSEDFMLTVQSTILVWLVIHGYKTSTSVSSVSSQLEEPVRLKICCAVPYLRMGICASQTVDELRRSLRFWPSHVHEFAGELNLHCQLVLGLMPEQSFPSMNKPFLSKLLQEFRARQAAEESKNIHEFIANAIALVVGRPPGVVPQFDIVWSL